MIDSLGRLIGSAALILVSLMMQASAGTLAKDDLDKLFEEHYLIGEMQSDLPVYPLFFKNPDAPDSKPELKAYVFESNDIVSVRGYSGKPINILIVIDLSGHLLSARLLDHKEPIFIDPYGNSKLADFAAQYKGLTLRHHIEIGKSTDTPSRNDQTAYLRGVHRGTITVKAMNRTIMTAAAKVAIAKLKIAVAPNIESKYADSEESPSSAPEVRPGPEPHAESKSSEPVKTSSGTTEKNVMPDSPEPLPANTAPSQNAPVSNTDKPLTTQTPHHTDGTSLADTTAEHDALSVPTLAVNAGNTVYLSEAQHLRDEWLGLWQSRASDIVIVLIGLCLLTAGLIAQRYVSADRHRLRRLRTLYLLFTLGFIGWFAQGQLTIVNITAALESLRSGGDLSFLMNDPITVILWLFTGATLLVWGRGTFCGWLCPFGALQELISLLANAIGVRQRRLRAALDAKLKGLKYAILFVLIAAIFIMPGFTDTAVEIEPFKTAISFYFQRDWPYVVWAVACLMLGVVVYRGYCRYLCPLGAALASVSFLQRWSWIPRREACGTPCQTCRHRCEYQAITPTGKVIYRECFQCLDCVSIYQDDTRCLPLIQQKKRPGIIAVHPVPANRG